MLDDLKYIHQKDVHDALGIAEKQYEQLDHQFAFSREPDIHDIHNVVYAGMGGSALAAQLSLTWPGYSLPFEICRDYDLPPYTNQHTLVIVSSYSGNTEEELENLQEAIDRSAQIIVVTGGGRLADIALEKNLPMLTIPKTQQPRYAVLYDFKALVTIIKHFNLSHAGNMDDILAAAREHLTASVQGWLPTVPSSSNQAKHLAQELMGRSVVVYAGPKLFPAAYKWKISINENAKNVAWCNQFSEFHHNEFIGWSSHPVDKPYGIVQLQSSFEHERIQKRFGLTNRLLSGLWPEPIELPAQGESLLQHLLWSVALGDFVSLYLALLNGVDPTPVALIEKFKQELK